jgi:hypothetical protein
LYPNGIDVEKFVIGVVDEGSLVGIAILSDAKDRPPLLVEEWWTRCRGTCMLSGFGHFYVLLATSLGSKSKLDLVVVEPLGAQCGMLLLIACDSQDRAVSMKS